MEKPLSIDLPPGLWANGTKYQAKGRWYDSSLVRFFQGTIRPVGGWVAISALAALSGTPRAAYTYNSAGTVVTVIGTTSKLYVYKSGTLYDITPVGMLNEATRLWHLDNFGTHCIATYVTQGGVAALPAEWDGDTSHVAVFIPATVGSPALAQGGTVVTPERFLFALGSAVASWSGGPDPTNISWASQETTSDWNPTASNTAGSFNLSTDGALMCGRRGVNQTLLWTTTDMHAATYIGGEFIYRFDQKGQQCGVQSIHSPVVLGNNAVWMGRDNFFVYDGAVSMLPCDVRDKVFGSFNTTYAHLVWGVANPKFGEVWWFYPSGSATECDRYVVYNYLEKHWMVGALGRSCGISTGASGLPIYVTSGGVGYTHESGEARTGASVYLESGPLELGDGERLMDVQKLWPDESTLGDVALKIYTALFPTATETLSSAFTSANPTAIRLKARQIRLRFDEVAATSWRIGRMRLGLIASSRR